jgi:hypothetical protein
VGKAVRVMSQTPTLFTKLLLEVGALSTCLNGCQTRLLVNVDQLVQSTKIN